MALPSKTWQQQSVPRVAGASGLEKVEWESGAGSSDSMNSYVRIYMHERRVSEIILENFPWLSQAYEERFQKSEWKNKFCVLGLIHMY